MSNKMMVFFKNLSERQKLFLLIGIAFILRLYAVLMAQGIAYDSAAYGFMARDFIKGNIEKALAIPGHPLYPFLISLFSMDTGQVEIIGRLISLFFGTFTVIPLYLLVKEAVGEKEAIFSILFYTFHPYLVTYSGMMLTEATYWGLLVLSVYFFWTGLKRDKIWPMALSGVLLGLAYLTRPEGIGYIAVYLGWIIVDGIYKKRWLRPLISIGALISTLFILGLPYVIYIQRETGQWLISKKAVEAQSHLFKKGLDEITPLKGVEQRNPEERNSKIIWMARNIVNHFPSVVYHYLRAFHYSLWPVLFFGLIRLRREGIVYEWFLASMVLLHLLSLSSFLPSTIRFSVPMIPLSLFWAGTGILEMKRFMEKIKIVSPEKAVLWMIAVVVFVQLPQSLIPERRHRAVQKEVGLWIKQNTPSDTIIMSNSPQEAFYADREFVMLPQEKPSQGDPVTSYEEIIHYAKLKGVRYLLVNKNTHERNPGLMHVLQSKEVSQLKNLKEVFKREEKSLTIYEVVY